MSIRLFVFAWIFPLVAFGQKVDIVGYVVATSLADDLKIEVTLTQPGKTLKKFADSEGAFEFKNVANADFTIAVKANGFKDFSQHYSIKEYVTNPAIFITLTNPLFRTREVDYGEYDTCMARITTADDKLAYIRRLIKTIDKNFTPHDEEYFFGYQVVAGYYTVLGMTRESLICYSKCLDAFDGHYPFEHRYEVAMVGPEAADAIYMSVAGMFMSLRLYESGLDFLDARKDKFIHNPEFMYRVTYYHFLCLANSYSKNYDKAIKSAEEIKKIAESQMALSSAESLDTSAISNEVRKSFAKEGVQIDTLLALRNRLNEAMSRLSVLSFYHADIATVYANQYNYKELAAHYLESEKILKKHTQFSQQLAATYKDYSAVTQETAEQANYKARLAKFQRLPTGPSTALIFALCKDNRAEEAKAHITDDLDQACWDLYTGNYKHAQQLYESYFARIKEFENDKDWGAASKSFYRGRMAYYARVLILSGQYDKALEFIRRETADVEESLKSGFNYFTETEKKELLRDYSKKLDFYFSALLSAPPDKLRVEELLNKLLQTKGIVFEYTQKQRRLRRKLSDPESRQQLEELKERRKKQVSFNELFSKNQQPYLRDSLLQNGKVIGDLERKINLKAGEEVLFSKIVWQDIQKKLKPGEAYVDIARIERENFKFDQPVIQYWAFVIKAGNALPESYLIGEGKTFEGRGLMNYQNRIRAMLEDEESYPIYWGVINKAVSGYKKLFLASDGVYNLLNPATLKNPVTQAFVLDETDVQRLASGRELLAPPKATSPVQSFRLLGNPDFKMRRKSGKEPGVHKDVELAELSTGGNRSGFVFAELPGTQKEVDIIQQIALGKGIVTQVLEGDNATEDTIKHAPASSVLHFATHGVFYNIQDENDSYMKSKLVLAGAGDSEPFTLDDYEKYEDGFLSAYEVMQLDLSATQLVVLSACETGIGDVEGGEGVWGLQRAFQVAGAHSVMGSLWRIDDATTVFYMGKFYEHWLGGSSLPEAHRFAMLQTREKYKYPNYWGPFVLLSR